MPSPIIMHTCIEEGVIGVLVRLYRPGKDRLLLLDIEAEQQDCICEQRHMHRNGFQVGVTKSVLYATTKHVSYLVLIGKERHFIRSVRTPLL